MSKITTGKVSGAGNMNLNRTNHAGHRMAAKIAARIGFGGTLGIAGAHLKVYPDDVFIVSYPRSGNTWMRFLVGELVFQREMDFHNVQELVPDIYVSGCTHSYLESLKRPRYIKSHEPYDARYPKVIYLVRDPRDVAISHYYWMLKNKRQKKTLDDFLTAFVNGETTQKCLYRGWGNHVNSWYENANDVTNGLLYIRYEDLLADTAREVLRLASFLGLDVSEEHAARITSSNEFPRMQKKEDAGKAAPGSQGDGRPDIRLVRKGEREQWKEIFTEDQTAAFADAFAEVAGRFGYDLREEREHDGCVQAHRCGPELE
jgi:hypothetical protein